MAAPINVPRLGWSMEEGVFVEWLKRDGDQVQPGDALFVLESEKAAENIEAIDAGILHIPADAPNPGDKVKVGQVIGHLLATGETAPTASPVKAMAPPVSVAAPAGPAARRLARELGVDLAGAAGTGAGGRITESDIRRHGNAATQPATKRAITPRARRAAKELGVNPDAVQGTGRNGRIRERDIRVAATTVPDGQLIPHTRIRKLIAERMVAGVTQAAPVTLTTKANAGNLVNFRNQFKSAGDEPVPGYTDLVVKLTAAALKQHPLLQAQWRDDGLFVPNVIHIAVAVDTEAGLLVPVLRDVDRLTLRQVASLSRDLAARAKSRQLTPAEMRDATFTVTNLGAFGVDAFTPILNLPQCAVLGVGRIVREPIVADDKIVPGDTLTLSLTFDHRIVDGAPAARFLATLRRCVEQPAPWLMP